MILKGGLGLTSDHKKSLNIILTVLTEIMDRVTTSFLNHIKKLDNQNHYIVSCFGHMTIHWYH